MTPLILAAAFSLITASDAAQTSTAKPPAAAAHKAKDSKDDPDRVICRSEPVPNSRFNQRVCLTKSQWDEKNQEAQSIVNDIQNHTGMPGN